MTASSARTENRAKTDTAISCGNRRRALRLNSTVMQKSRDLFPVKTALHLSDLTGYSLRSCEYWLSGKVVIPADALAALIRSERGREFLAAVMADHAPRWWVLLKAFFKRIDADTLRRQAMKAYREMLDVEAQSHPFALPVGDEDFFEGQPSPVSTVAPKRKR